MHPPVFASVLLVKIRKYAGINEGDWNQTTSLSLTGLQYLHSPADGGVVLQLPVTMSPRLDEFPPVFLQQRHPVSGEPTSWR